jgi:hypothetical protein
MRRFCVLLSLLLGLGLPTSAHAGEPAPTREWYGWQIAIADAVSSSLFIAGAAAKSGSLAFVGGAAFVMASPITHLVHENPGPGVGAFGLRLVLPVTVGLGALFAHGLLPEGERHPSAESLFVPMAIAAVAGAALDIGLLAYDRKPAVHVGVGGIHGSF